MDKEFVKGLSYAIAGIVIAISSMVYCVTHPKVDTETAQCEAKGGHILITRGSEHHCVKTLD